VLGAAIGFVLLRHQQNREADRAQGHPPPAGAAERRLDRLDRL
jgi:hypothetical protein